MLLLQSLRKSGQLAPMVSNRLDISEGCNHICIRPTRFFSLRKVRQLPWFQRGCWLVQRCSVVKNPCCKGPLCLYINIHFFICDRYTVPMELVSHVIFYTSMGKQRLGAWYSTWRTDAIRQDSQPCIEHPWAFYRETVTSAVNKTGKACCCYKRSRLALAFTLITVSKLNRVSRMSRGSRTSIALIEQ